MKSTTIFGSDSLRLRTLILALLLVGMVGLAAELLLLEHYEDWEQLIPLVLLGAGVVGVAAAWVRPTPRTIRILQGVMTLFIVAGLLGVWFHYRGNVEFELERQPSLSGLMLLWESLRGATPALAPAALTQLGLLGLLFSYRHPAFERGGSTHLNGER